MIITCSPGFIAIFKNSVNRLYSHSNNFYTSFFFLLVHKNDILQDRYGLFFLSVHGTFSGKCRPVRRSAVDDFKELSFLYLQFWPFPSPICNMDSSKCIFPFKSLNFVYNILCIYNGSFKSIEKNCSHSFCFE